MKHPIKEIKKIADRITEVRGDFSRNDFGYLIGESGSSIQNYEKGQHKQHHTIPCDVLIKISQKFKINLCWLIEGPPHEKFKNNILP